MKFYYVCSVFLQSDETILNEIYSKKSKQIVKYLTSFVRFTDMNTKKFNVFKNEIFKFKMQNRQLYKRNTKNVFFKRVIDDLIQRQKILTNLHDENEHKNRKNTYKRIANRYWWIHLYDDVKIYVKFCDRCQLRNLKRKKKFYISSEWAIYEKK